MKMSNIKRCYNVAATLFGNIQRCSNVIGNISPLSLKVATQRCGNAHVTFLDNVFTTFTQCCGNVVETLKRCYNLKLFAGILKSIAFSYLFGINNIII